MLLLLPPAAFAFMSVFSLLSSLSSPLSPKAPIMAFNRCLLKNYLFLVSFNRIFLIFALDSVSPVKGWWVVHSGKKDVYGRYLLRLNLANLNQISKKMRNWERPCWVYCILHVCCMNVRVIIFPWRGLTALLILRYGQCESLTVG